MLRLYQMRAASFHASPFPVTPELRHTRRPPRRVDVLARIMSGVANSGEAMSLLDAPRAPSSNGSLSCGFSENWHLYRIVIVAAADSWGVTNAARRAMEELGNEHRMSPCPRVADRDIPCKQGKLKTDNRHNVNPHKIIYRVARRGFGVSAWLLRGAVLASLVRLPLGVSRAAA
jgi:hypothetical protein